MSQKNTMNYRFFFTTLLLLFAVNLGFATNTKLIGYKLLKHWTVEDLKKKWASHSDKLEILVPIQNEIDVYDVDYWTKWHDGSAIRASGLYIVPVNPKQTPAQLIYHHGTSVKKERGGVYFNGEETLCYFFAVDAYCVVMPDYIGLGRGEKRHLYQHAQSESQAAIDMLEATNEINEQLKVKTSGQLFLTGYSQGGHSAMATHKRLQEDFKGKYLVTASGPMSGAYDMTGAQVKYMFEPYTQPHYLPYLIYSYQEAYNIFPSPDINKAIFRPPYDTIIPAAFDGRLQHHQINDILPKVPKDIFKDSLVEEFKHNPEFAFRKRLGENSNYDWKPETPVQMCFCKSDEEVSYKNAIVAYKKMRENGAKRVKKFNVSNRFSHGHCAGFSAIHTKMYFDSFRKGSKNGRKGPLGKRIVLAIAKTMEKETSLKKRREHLMAKKI